jgi:hypothetical protein
MPLWSAWKRSDQFIVRVCDYSINRCRVARSALEADCPTCVHRTAVMTYELGRAKAPRPDMPARRRRYLTLLLVASIPLGLVSASYGGRVSRL